MKSKIFLFALLGLIIASCNNNFNTAKEDDHDDVKIQLTAYSSEFEVFAEADPFIVGKSSNVLSHFSHLSSYKALENGSMTIRLIINNNEVFQTLDEPTRKGIYSFDVKPEIQGRGQILFDIKTEEEVFHVIIPDVMVYSTEEEAIAAAEKVFLSKTNTTVFTKEQSWKIDFSTEFPKKEPFGQIIKTTAQIQSAQGDEIIVTAKTNGIVILSPENILEGKNVSIGQYLVTVSGNDLASNNSSVRFAEAKSNFEKTKADFERLQELAKDRVISEKELLDAKNQFDNAKATFDNLNINFSSAGQKVASPMSGFIKLLFVENGQYVEAGQPIVVISQNKKLVLYAEVQQKYASLLTAIHTANIRTLHNNQTYPLEQLNGSILSYGKAINSDNFLIPVKLQIDNKGGFVSGGFVELFLKTLTNLQALTIPNESLLEEQGNFFVFVQITPELFEKREVKIGSTDGLKTEIIGGVSLTDRIVSKGAILVKLAQSSGALDAHSGHVH